MPHLFAALRESDRSLSGSSRHFRAPPGRWGSPRRRPYPTPSEPRRAPPACGRTGQGGGARLQQQRRWRLELQRRGGSTTRRGSDKSRSAARSVHRCRGCDARREPQRERRGDEQRRQHQVCSGNACMSGCAVSGIPLCGTACVDTTSSNTDCGSCGHACAGNQHCRPAACVANSTGAAAAPLGPTPAAAAHGNRRRRARERPNG